MRVGALAWNGDQLSSGSRDRVILQVAFWQIFSFIKLILARYPRSRRAKIMRSSAGDLRFEMVPRWPTFSFGR